MIINKVVGPLKSCTSKIKFDPDPDRQTLATRSLNSLLDMQKLTEDVPDWLLELHNHTHHNMYKFPFVEVVVVLNKQNSHSIFFFFNSSSVLPLTSQK